MSKPLPALLSKLLALHFHERHLMQALSHEEHQACVAEKMDIARALERAMSDGAEPSKADLSIMLAIKEAAGVNAAIAEKMLAMAKGKIDMIQKLAGPSYGSDGRMSQPKSSGGLLNVKT